jgi:hypothetical protein
VLTKTATYDPAGRLKTSATSSTVGAALPSVSYQYGAKSGALVSQSATSEGTTRKITDEYNTVGQLVSYTDADGNTASYTYDPTTGYVTKLEDSPVSQNRGGECVKEERGYETSLITTTRPSPVTKERMWNRRCCTTKPSQTKKKNEGMKTSPTKTTWRSPVRKKRTWKR